MSRLVVTGYASLDYVLNLASEVAPDKTTHATRNAEAWPRPGGCPSYISLAAVPAGGVASPVMWLGQDPEANALIAHLQAKGVETNGVAQLPSVRSPAAVLTYDPSGACSCLYDPGMAGQETLSAAQQDIIAQASHLCISVGPAHLTEQILDLRAPDARLYWAVKDDPTCFHPAMCERLSATADVIFCNAIERPLVGSSTAIIVQTQGAQGVRVEGRGDSLTLPVTPIAARDTTGAGDTFAGGFIGAEMAGDVPPKTAAQAGIDAAAALLMQRLGESV